MPHYTFISGNSKSLDLFISLDNFIDNFYGYQVVYLDNINELYILLDLIGIVRYEIKNPTNSKFKNLFDISKINLPVMSDEEFEIFYQEWLSRTGRESSMDEYGSLIFLTEMSDKMNKYEYRLIVEE